MIEVNAAMVSAAAEFTGKYSPYQAIEIRPNSAGVGVFISATDSGRIAFMAFDETGKGDCSVHLLPTSELLKHARPLKTATRTLRIEDSQATVITERKTKSESIEIPITLSKGGFADLAGVMQQVAQRWGKTPSMAETCGRYDAIYLQRAFKAIDVLGGSVVMAALDGGPLRIESSNQDVIVLVMPQTANPIPSLPDFLLSYGQTGQQRAA